MSAQPGSPVTGLDDDEIAYLAGLVRDDIRKRERGVRRFTPYPGQDPDEAGQILGRFRAKLDWCREVLGRLADATRNPRTWRASAVSELDLGGEEETP